MPPGRRAFCLALSLAGLAGCNLDNPGDPPPQGKLYFPNAIVLSPVEPGEAPSHLFVANSNFDLRYRGGSVQAFSLERLDEELAGCEDDAECVIEPHQVLDSEVLIDAFSTSLAVAPDGSKLFVPTRTDSSLTVIDVEVTGGRADLSCRGSGVLCASNSERGIERWGQERLPWPIDPVAVVSGRLEDFAPGAPGVYAVVAHRGGEASLFVEQSDGRMLMTGYLRQRFPGLTNAAYDAETGLLYMTVEVGTDSKVLARLGVTVPTSEGEPDVAGASLYDASSIRLTGADTSADTQDIVFVPSFLAAGAALAEPRALILSQRPDSLMVADVNPERNEQVSAARVLRTIVVGAGASRLSYGTIEGKPLAVIACFAAREIYVVDLATLQARSVVPNLSGPFEIELDAARKRLYVADFRSSVIRIVDLAPVVAGEGNAPARIAATLGRPQILQELL
jgi:hypothetical protein